MGDVRKSVKNGAGGPAGHAHHDRTLISRYAADDAYQAEVQEARSLVELCADCAALAADIRSLSAALAISLAPRRPRDFRLTGEQAEQLRGSAFDRFLRRLAAPGLASARPLAGVALSLGLAIAVIGAALPTPGPSVMSMDSQRAPAEAAPDDDSFGAPAEPLAEPAPGAPGAEDDPRSGPAGGSPDQPSDGVEEQLASDAAVDDTRLMLIAGGLVLALIALGALILIIFARRRVDDPLPR